MKNNMTLSLARLSREVKRRSGLRIEALSILLTVMIAAALTLGLRDSFAQSSGPTSPPDYSKVDDFLNGRRDLLRNDDLVIGFNYTDAPSIGPRKVLFSAGTANSVPAIQIFSRIVPYGQGSCQDPQGCTYDTYDYPDSALSTGRFFNTYRDTVVQFPFRISHSNAPLLVSLTSNMKAGLSWSSSQDISFVAGASLFLSDVADFNGDGYDDLLMSYNDTAKLRIATAVDVNDPRKGFSFGPELTLNNGGDVRRMTTGDFNGDGRPEIAILYEPISGSLNLAIYSVDQKTLTIAKAGETTVAQVPDLYRKPLEIEAGHFTFTNHKQLIVGYILYTGGNDPARLSVIDFDNDSLQPRVVSRWDSGSGGTTLSMKTGRFDWSSPFDQVAWMVDNNGPVNCCGTRLSVLTVDPSSLAVTRKADIGTITEWGSLPGGLSLAVGNFDHQRPSAQDATKLERDPNLQIAVLGVRKPLDNPAGPGGTALLNIYDVAPDASTLTLKSSSILDQGYFGNHTIAGLTLVAGDLQGRSLRLGAGYRVTIDRTAPSVILAAPPMHADYVSPGLGKAPTVLNLSVAPDGYHAEYEQTDSSDDASTYKFTDSSTFATEESVGSSVSAGKFDPISGELENGVKVEAAIKAKQDSKDSTEDINGTFKSTDFEIKQETGLSDVVWFKDTSIYLYIYPVIGQKVCPAGKPNCQEGEKKPLTVTFSAPKEATIQRLASDTLEWYQPPWEPGNLFSYPASLAQLKQYVPDLSLLTQQATVFATDDANATLKTTWINGKKTGQNVVHETLNSIGGDISLEIKAEATIFGIGAKAEIKGSLSVDRSHATEDLTESETQLKSATGITIQKSAVFAEPFFYKYFFSPYIFGREKPSGLTDESTTAADLRSYGVMRSAFTADPLANGAGGWWKQAYNQFPDVAVNHPNRWSFLSSPKPSNQVLPSNCVGVDALRMNCVRPAEREPANPWLDQFHDMRGLFITSALSPGQGAQRQIATAGDKLSLQTRVYNYSLKSMPAGTKVKVRFYGMEWDVTTNLPADHEGESFLIGETTLSPIAPFDSGPNAPLNWALAGVTFDTTAYENKDLVFWVVAWMEDAGGKLVQELPGHGLAAIPENTAKPTFEELTKLEEMVNNPLKLSPGDPDLVSFSNNIGFYRFPFHVEPKTSFKAPNGPAEVKVEEVKVGAASLKPGESVEVSVMLRNGAQSLTGVPVYFYSGDPEAGGRLVDVERLANIRAGGRHKVSILFRPQDCGSQRIFIKVAPGKAYAVSGQASQSIQVECPTPVCASQVCMRSAQYYALNLNQLPKGMVTVAGQGAHTKVSTGDTARMRILLGGGTSAQQRFNQQFVTTQLNLLGQTGFNQAALRSNLLCYNLNFQPTQLGTGAVLSPSMTLGELFDQALQAGRSNEVIDMRMIANLLQLLNGDDPLGRCR